MWMAGLMCLGGSMCYLYRMAAAELAGGRKLVESKSWRKMEGGCLGGVRGAPPKEFIIPLLSLMLNIFLDKTLYIK